MSERVEKMPASAFMFQAESGLDITPGNEGNKSAPFRMVARTNRPLDHPRFGRVIHDFAGMRLPGDKNRIAIDYQHDPNTLIGYGNRFPVENGELVIMGALTPTSHNEKATEIIDLAREGVPFQSSISFGGGDGLTLETVGEDQTVEVNGEQFSGPLTVVREWTLVGAAVTPAGHDSNTTVDFNSGREITVRFIKHEQEDLSMSQDNQTAKPVETPEKVEDASQVNLNNQEAPREAPVEAPSRKTEGSTFMEHFGEQQGAIYFARGFTFEQALAADNKRLRERVDDLASKFSGIATSGEEEAVGGSEAPKTETLAKLQGEDGKNSGEIADQDGLAGEFENLMKK